MQGKQPANVFALYYIHTLLINNPLPPPPPQISTLTLKIIRYHHQNSLFLSLPCVQQLEDYISPYVNWNMYTKLFFPGSALLVV